VLRTLTVGPLAVVSWFVFMLVLAVHLPFLLIIGLVGGSGARSALRWLGSWFLRTFFVSYMPLIRFHRFAELPDRAALAAGEACVYVANHRSWLDALLALALFPRIRMPVAVEYTRIPLLGIVIRWMGCLPLDTSSPATVVEAVELSRKAVAEGHCLFVFPEGGRSPGRHLLGFSDAFFRVALDCQVTVVPVLLHSDEPYLTPGNERMVPARLPTWRVRLLEPVGPDRRDRPADIGRRVRKSLAAELSRLDVGADQAREGRSS
jgi:1-acyl-sn-glycerol-3-phosphate acyltransferase